MGQRSSDFKGQKNVHLNGSPGEFVSKAGHSPVISAYKAETPYGSDKELITTSEHKL